MPEPRTPGQIAYEGYMRVHFGTGAGVAWGYDMLEPHERDAWESAAQAVPAHHTQRGDMHTYAASGGRNCPACGGADIAHGNETTFTSCAIRRVMLCENCGAGWKAVYTLSGYEDLRVPLPEEGDHHATTTD